MNKDKYTRLFYLPKARSFFDKILDFIHPKDYQIRVTGISAHIQVCQPMRLRLGLKEYRNHKKKIHLLRRNRVNRRGFA